MIKQKLQQTLFNYLFKTIIIGDTNAGKTSIINKMTSNKYKNNTPTIGIDFASFITTLPNKECIKCQIWDTAGQEKFKSIIHSYYHNIAGCIFVYDVTDKKSFDKIHFWFDDLNNHINDIDKIVSHSLEWEKTSRKNNFKKNIKILNDS